MVDKNSSLKNNFIDNLRLGIDQLPAFMSNILTRATEIPFEATSDIVVEPILRFLVPGTSEEERQQIKADIAAKDATKAAFLEGARGRIQNILQLPPKSKEQFDAIRLLEDDMVAIGYPKTTVMDVLNKGREFFFGDTYDIHKKVADGVIRPSELEGQDLANYLIGFVDVADVAGIGSGVISAIRKALGKQDFGALRNIVETIPSEKMQEVSRLLDDIDTTKGKGKFQVKKVAPRIDKINEIVKKVQAGELEPNLGIDQYEGLSRDFFNKALTGKYSFDVEQYLDLPLDEIQQLLASKKSLRMRNFEKNYKDIEEYISKADAESLSNEEMADLFDVNIDMIKRNFSSKPEYKFKFKQSKYATPSDNYSFEKILKENQEELGIKEVRKEGNKDRAEYLLFDGLFRSTSNKQLGLSNDVSRSEAAKVFIEYMKKEKPNWRVEYRDELNNLAYLDQQRAIANKTITSMFNDYATKYPEQFANENLTEYKLQISHNFPLRGDPKFLGGAGLDAARLIYSRTNLVHHAKIESQVLKIKNDVGETGKITEEQLKKLEELDKKAKKLGTLYFTDIGGETKYIGAQKAPGINTLVNALEKHFVEISKRKGAGRNIKGEYIPGNFSSKEIGVTGEYGDEFIPRPFNEGGEVETEQEEQSFLSKAASAVSNFIIPQAEALPLPKNFLLGDTPKLVKKTETVKQLPAPEAPILEKRYNIFDENGQKVYQSKSMDDAQQKALRLGDLEGKTFTVKEIEVPIKVKKSKTTKPGTSLVPTIVPENAIGSGNNKLFYSDLNSVINTDTGNLTIKGITVPNDTVEMSAKEWHDWFRSKGIKEGELYDSYVRSYLNKKGGFNRETGQFTNDEKISFAEIKELVDTSPTNYIQTVSYSDEAGNLKYGNSGRQDDYISGSRTERVLWLDSKDIRGDIGSLPSEIQQYEGHRQMREVRSSDDFMAQENKLDGEPYVIGWSLGSNRIGKLNNKDIVVTVADEIQSDFLQKAASLKSDIKQEIRQFLNRSQNQQIGRNEGLELLYKKLENVFRPMPATYQQLKKSLDELIESDAIFQKISEMEIDDLTKESFKELGEAAKVRDKALATINATIDKIDSRELFPNIPFKDQKDWVDAIIKNDVYNAAKKRFSFVDGALVTNTSAPSHYGVAPNKAVKAYRGGRGVELPPDSVDRKGSMVAYDMQYGGPNLTDHTGAHFTGNVEESLNKIANAKNSKVEVGKVPFGMAGEGVDTFMIELTPDMLFPYKAYKKDGGLVKKSILYTPIVSVNELLSPIGASKW